MAGSLMGRGTVVRGPTMAKTFTCRVVPAGTSCRARGSGGLREQATRGARELIGEPCPVGISVFASYTEVASQKYNGACMGTPKSSVSFQRGSNTRGMLVVRRETLHRGSMGCTA